MRIIIDDHQRLGDIQQLFNDHYPYLKLVFFGAGSADENPFVQGNRINDPDTTIEMIRRFRNNGVLFVHGNQRVDNVETLFSETFGINVQVYRKLGNVWLQTEASNLRTLSGLNTSGKAMDEGIVDVLDFEDYHEQL